MIPGRSIAPLVAVGVFAAGLLATAADEGDSPRAVIEAAIKAHGGVAALNRTLCGNFTAKMTAALGPGIEGTMTFEENYELPRRYRRKVQGEEKGKKFEMEFAIDGDSGWIRRNGVVSDYPSKSPTVPMSGCNILLTLPNCLADGVKLRSAGVENIAGQPARKVEASGDALQGEATLLLDEKTNRLVELRRRVSHPATGKMTELVSKLGNYKTVDGIPYPHRLQIVQEGKTIMDIEISRIDFPKTLDDKLFAKPE